MSQTFLFEELDGATREYLLAVRDSQGEGAPGVFAPTTSTMAGCGCISGPIIITLTLLFTLTTWVDVIYKDPARVAFLQTAGLVLGGWLLVAGLRSNATKNSAKAAGHWVYVDPLHLYQAYREQVTVTPIDDVVEAKFTHNYNNGAYQNSVVSALRGEGQTVKVTLNNEARAEQMVVYLNYLAWARGPEGGDRRSLAPAGLGGVAKYVAVHDVEPKNHADEIDLNLVELEITEVPAEPTREGRAAPAVLPYVLILAAGVGIFFLMKEVVNPPLRDDALFQAVSTPPCEPWFLQQYLLDERNSRHRDEVKRLLAAEYDRLIRPLEQPPPEQNLRPLRQGMLEVLRSLKETARPVVSLRVSEAAARPGAQERADKFRDGLVGKIDGLPTAQAPQYFVARGGIVGRFAELAPPVQPRDGIAFNPPRTAVGIQLVEFASKPEEAAHAHFEVTYEFVPVGANSRYALRATVEVRTDLDGAPVATYSERGDADFPEADFDRQLGQLRDRLGKGFVGQQAQPGQPAPPAD